ncbi:MAG TPA: DUF3987 domain-containing protein [Bacteroidia bacterium]|nr:DUF3987 domain-containing protein [Bacteroidia bacterium]
MEGDLSKGLKLGKFNTPAFDETIYGELPPFLKKVCMPFIETEVERDIVLLSSLITFSACFPRVTGTYDYDELNANLYGIIIAPPASGKGVAKHGTALGNQIQNSLDRGNEIKAINDKIAKAAEEEAENEVKKEEKVVQKNFFLPANTSSTFLIKQIKANEERGNLIFDSEADTLGNVMGQDWAKGVSEVLRKSFHHERTAIGRAGDDLMINIKNPKLSLLLTGTPGQLGGIIKSVEDGLFSRCILYAFDTEANWKDVSPTKASESINNYYDNLAVEVFEMYEHFLAGKYQYVLTAKQWEEFNRAFKWMLKTSIQDYGEAVQGIVKRAGVMGFRLSMIFNILAHFENKNKSLKIECNDKYLTLSIRLMRRLLIHILEVFNKVNQDKTDNSRMDQFIRSLPEGEFRRGQAATIGRAMGFSLRTADTYLQEAVKAGILLHPNSGGVYRKVKKQ